MVEPHDLISDDWAQFLIEDWQDKLDKLGFFDAKIMFSGFGSQGDGACFEATIKKDWSKRVPKPVLDELTTYVVQMKLEGKDDSWWSWWWPLSDWDIEASLKHSGLYYHANTMSVEMSDVSLPGNDMDLPLFYKWWFGQLPQELNEECKNLAREIYRDLEQAYDAEYEHAEEEAKRMNEEEEKEEENDDESTVPEGSLQSEVC